MTKSLYPLLFSSITIHSLTLKNRIVMPPMCTNLATIGGAVTERMIDYYTARALGGVGLINVEFAYVRADGKVFEHMLGIYDDKLIPGLQRLTEAVHQGGAKIFIQLAHGGRRAHSEITGTVPVAPSPIPRLNGETPHELSKEEIEDLIQDFILGARRAQKAGFDGVMIHMAHGYLLQQFLSPLSNKRKDEYGGELEGRARFPVEVLKSIRKEVGADYPISCRLCGDEFIKGGFDLSQSIRVAKMLEANGANALEISAGTHETGYIIAAPPYYSMGFLAPLSAAIKKEVNIPVGIVGRIHTPAVAEQILQEGKADLIAIGRGLIADPEWPKKAQEGKPETIRPCLSCNQGCSDRMYWQRDISCTVNPLVGRETTYPIKVAAQKRKIIVIGGGPAGLEAAKIAAIRGHNVYLYEKEENLGGQLNIASVPPGKERLKELRDYLIQEVKQLPIKIIHKKLSTSDIEKIKPHWLVVAVGGRPKSIEAVGFDDSRVVNAWEVLRGKEKVGEKVLIIGGGQVGLETAHFLLEQGKEITILEMLKQVGLDMSPRARKVIIEKLIKGGVEIITEAKAIALENGEVIFDRGGLKEKFKGADSIVIAVGTEAEAFKITGLKKLKIPVRFIGDALSPRKLFDAIHEGFLVGMEI